MSHTHPFEMFHKGTCENCVHTQKKKKTSKIFCAPSGRIQLLFFAKFFRPLGNPNVLMLFSTKNNLNNF